VDERRSLPDFPAPDADLAATVSLLDATELAGASDVDVVAAIAGWQQVMDAASAAQAAAISELTKRRPVSRDGVADEVALALTCTRYRATHLIGRAHGLDAFAVLRDALAGGTLDAAKVDLLLDEVACLPDDDADAVLRDVLAGADGLTTTHLRRLVRRQVLATRPEVARTRAAKARRERCVTLQHGPDAMAWVHAYLPAADAVAMFGVVDALAWAQRAADEERTIDQRRADALSGLFGGILATGALPDGTALPAPQGHRVGVQVAVGATTLLGLDDLPGELVGYGPIPAAMARDLARDGTWRRVLTDPAGHVLHVDDHTHPAGAVARERVGERRTADPGAWERAGDRRTAGRDGPSGVSGSPGYRPGARLRRYVLVRDQVCAFAGCSVPAWRCDLDHAVPYDAAHPEAGPTCACNLRPLCRRHHRLKTHAGWSVTHDPDTGFTSTTSPTGLTYLRPSPTLLATAPGEPPSTGSPSTGSPSTGSPPTPQPGRDEDDEPPF
jgi:hypothetical protein